MLAHLVLLTLLCAAVYGLGLTSHGLTNWQEAQRALVAREMQVRGEWIVPTVDGRPYLAKPPMIYWCQLALAALRGTETGDFELRLTVALAGWLGVVATYVVARRMLGPTPAWWASLFLATGFLYARSSRIGELDILLAPFTVAAVGAIWAGWATHREMGKTNLRAAVVAALAATGAMLTKGPPGLLAIALAGYGGMAVWEAWNHERGAPRISGPVRWTVALLTGLAFAGAAWWSWRDEPWSGTDIAGVFILFLVGTVAGATLVRLADLARLGALFKVYSRTHPIGVLGVPVLALWGWGRIVTARIGPDRVADAVRAEAADNLRMFVPESPVNNLEAMAFGVGLGSVLALGSLACLVWKRPKLTREMAVMLAWVVGGFIAFSVLGKGVARYLTPLWPGIALLGGWTIASWMSSARKPWRLAGWAYASVACLAVGEAFWYGWAREHSSGSTIRAWLGQRPGDEPGFSARSPRAMMRELASLPEPTRRDRLVMFEFETPAVDVYAGFPVEAVGDVVRRPGVVGIGPRTLADLRRRLVIDGGSIVVLYRQRQPDGMTPESARSRIEGAGFSFEEIPLKSRFRIDNWRTDVGAARISLAPGD